MEKNFLSKLFFIWLLVFQFCKANKDYIKLCFTSLSLLYIYLNQKIILNKLCCARNYKKTKAFKKCVGYNYKQKKQPARCLDFFPFIFESTLFQTVVLF